MFLQGNSYGFSPQNRGVVSGGAMPTGVRTPNLPGTNGTPGSSPVGGATSDATGEVDEPKRDWQTVMSELEEAKTSKKTLERQLSSLTMFIDALEGELSETTDPNKQVQLRETLAKLKEQKRALSRELRKIDLKIQRLETELAQIVAETKALQDAHVNSSLKDFSG